MAWRLRGILELEIFKDIWCTLCEKPLVNVQNIKFAEWWNPRSNYVMLLIWLKAVDFATGERIMNIDHIWLYIQQIKFIEIKLKILGRNTFGTFRGFYI